MPRHLRHFLIFMLIAKVGLAVWRIQPSWSIRVFCCEKASILCACSVSSANKRVKFGDGSVFLYRLEIFSGPREQVVALGGFCRATDKHLFVYFFGAG